MSESDKFIKTLRKQIAGSIDGQKDARHNKDLLAELQLPPETHRITKDGVFMMKNPIGQQRRNSHSINNNNIGTIVQ